MMTNSNADAPGDQGSPFNAAAQDLVGLGYHVVPLAPEKKYPGEISRGEWKPMGGWQRFRDRQPTGFEWQVWKDWTGANAKVFFPYML